MKTAIIFLGGIIFFTLYAWAHLSLAWLQKYTGNSHRVILATLILSALTMLLVWLPLFLSHAFSLSIPTALSEPLFFFSNTWLMLELWFGFTALFCDGINLFHWLYQRHAALAPSASLLLSWRLEALICAAFTLIAATVGFFQTGRPVIRHTIVHSSKVPPEADGYRIMLCSDLHLVPLYRTAILDRIEAATQKWQPNLFLHVGDFTDGPRSRNLEKLTERLSRWHFPDGKYASFGNHDGYADWEQSRKWHEAAGLTLLGARVGNPVCDVTPWLHLGAVDDQAVWIKKYNKHMSDALQAEAIAKCENIPAPPATPLNILLRHRPDLRADHFKGWDLMLSGHTHGGQIFPFNLTIPFTCPYSTSRWHSIDTGLQLYICQGTGFWGPPFRFLVPSEITVIELRVPQTQSTTP